MGTVKFKAYDSTALGLSNSDSHKALRTSVPVFRSFEEVTKYMQAPAQVRFAGQGATSLSAPGLPTGDPIIQRRGATIKVVIPVYPVMWFKHHLGVGAEVTPHTRVPNDMYRNVKTYRSFRTEFFRRDPWADLDLEVHLLTDWNPGHQLAEGYHKLRGSVWHMDRHSCEVQNELKIHYFKDGVLEASPDRYFEWCRDWGTCGPIVVYHCGYTLWIYLTHATPP